MTWMYWMMVVVTFNGHAVTALPGTWESKALCEEAAKLAGFHAGTNTNILQYPKFYCVPQ